MPHKQKLFHPRHTKLWKKLFRTAEQDTPLAELGTLPKRPDQAALKALLDRRFRALTLSFKPGGGVAKVGGIAARARAARKAKLREAAKVVLEARRQEVMKKIHARNVKIVEHGRLDKVLGLSATDGSLMRPRLVKMKEKGYEWMCRNFKPARSKLAVEVVAGEDEKEDVMVE